MLKKRILASSMASVMALTSISAVAFADTTLTDIGENNFGEKTIEDLKEYMESDYIQEKLNAGDYAKGVTADFEDAYNYATNVVNSNDDMGIEITVAYRELQATAKNMEHHTLEQVKKLIEDANKILGDGNYLERGNPDLKYEAAGYDTLRSVTSSAEVFVADEYENKKRDVIDQYWEDLTNAIKGIKELEIVYLDNFVAVMQDIEKLQNQDTKYDAWTRVTLPEVKDSNGDVVKGYSNYTVAYGYFIWRMNDLAKLSQADLEHYNALGRKKTTITEYVDAYHQAQRLLAVFDAGVNQAKPIDGTKTRAYAGDIEALIGVSTATKVAGTYHNRLVYDYATSADYAARQTAVADSTAGAYTIAATDATNELTPDKQKNAKELIDQLLKLCGEDGRDWKLQYQDNAAKINANGTKPAATWVDVTDGATFIDSMWSLNYNDTSKKLGDAQLIVRVVRADGSNNDVTVAYVQDAKGYIKGFYKDADTAKEKVNTVKASGVASEYAKGLADMTIGGGSPIDLAKAIDLSPTLTNAAFLSAELPGLATNAASASTVTDNARGEYATENPDTNVGNSVRDGASSDSDHFIGWFDNYTTDVFGNGITASDDNSDHAPVGIKTDATVYTTVDFLKALSAAQYLLDGNPDKTTVDGSASADYGVSPLVLNVAKSGTKLREEIVDIVIDTNADWLSTFAKAADNNKPYQWAAASDKLTEAESNASLRRAPSTAEYTNVYNYVLYALTDAYGSPVKDAAAQKLHTKEDVLSMVNKIRDLTKKTYGVKLFNDYTDMATKAANDAYTWYGIASKNASWKDNTDNVNQSQAILEADAAQLFKSGSTGKYYVTSHGGTVFTVSVGDLDLTDATGIGVTASDTLYHALEGTYLKLLDLYTKFEHTYQEVAELIAECEKDYASNKSKQTPGYAEAIRNCAYWLSVVKAPTWGNYIGDDFEAYSVSREFLGNNRINAIATGDSYDGVNHQSDSQKELLKAYETLKKAKAGDTDEPIECKLRGDADDNGSVTAADATAILKSLVGAVELTEDGEKNAAAADGKAGIAAADATAVLKYLANEKWD